MVKAIFFDVDGTLLSHSTKQVPDSAKKSLKKLREKGIKIFVSTGRHLSELQDFPIYEMEFDGYIMLNGQLGLDQRRNLLYGIPFSKKITTELVSLFRKNTMPVILVGEKHMYINFVNDLVREVQEEISSDIPEIMEYDGLPVYQACTYLRRGEEHLVTGKLPKGCKLTRWSSGGVDIISESGGKVQGMKEFLKLNGISKDEIMAFGDAENDIEMLEFSKTGVAMGNATEGVKKASDYVTDHIDQDGIAKALIHFGVL